MIAKIIQHGGSFKNCVNYVLKEDAEILISQGVRDYDKELMIKDFESVQGFKPELNKVVMHIPVSFPKEDTSKLTNETMAQIAEKYLTSMGFKNAPYLVVRHFDQPHAHFHIITSRIDLDGKVVQDSFSHLRSNAISRTLEEEYGLTPAQKKELPKTRLERLRGKDKVKYALYKAISKELYKASSIDDLAKRLKQHGVETELIKKNNGNIQGIKFSKDSHSFNGSKIDKQFSYLNLTKAISANQILTGSPNSDKIKVSPINIAAAIKRAKDYSSTHAPGNKEDADLQRLKQQLRF